MSAPSPHRPVAILAGRGELPPLVAAVAVRQRRTPVVFAIAGEAETDGFGSLPLHVVRWGEVGRLFRIAREAGCREAVFIGGIAQRPDYRSVRPDLGAVMLLPRILQIMRGGDDSLLSGVAALFEEKGLKLISALDLAPDLALAEGLAVGQASPEALANVSLAATAARAIGALDIGQGAVAVGGRVVAVVDVGGTAALLERVAALRESGRIGPPGGVLVKCMKPKQDSRIDLPTIGPGTAELARAAGLEGIAAEAGRTLLAGPVQTLEAFRRSGMFLLGIGAPTADG